MLLAGAEPGEAPGSRPNSERSRPRSAPSAPVTVSTEVRSTVVRFLDTDILLYSISRAPDERAKAERANEILQSRDLALSVQVLQEFHVQATRESRADRQSHAHAVKLVESYQRFPVAEISASIMLAAFVTRDRFGISYWDAAILEASRSLGCPVVLSEDLGEGQDYGGVRVENPFRTDQAIAGRQA